MSLRDIAVVKAEFSAKVGAKQEEYLKVQTVMNAARKRLRGAGRPSGFATAMSQAASRSSGVAAVLRAIMDYNAVELFFLGCAVLVNLVGITFLSDRFDPDTGMLEHYKYQYDALAYATIALVVVSIIYFFFLLAVEVTAVTSPTRAAAIATCLCSRYVAKATRKEAQGTSGGAAPVAAGLSGTSGMVEMASTRAISVNANPLLSKTGKPGTSKATNLEEFVEALPELKRAPQEWEAFHENVIMLADKYVSQIEELKRVKTEIEMSGDKSHRMVRVKGVSRRKLFGQVAVGAGVQAMKAKVKKKSPATDEV